MKRLIPVLSLVLILFACRKSEQAGQTKPEAAKYDVKFTVADFNVSKETMSTSGTKATMAAGDVLSDYADYLHCSIYNEEGFLVWYVNQKNDKDFGTIASRLGNGNYSVVIAAAKNHPLNFTLDSPAPYSVLRFSSGRPDGNFNDTFHKTFKITVTDQPLTQAVKLNRLVGAFDVVFTDPIPADIAKVTVTLYSESHTLTLDGTYYSRNSPSSYEYLLTAADAGKTNKTFSAYVIGTDWELQYDIRAYNSKNVLVAQKVIPSVKVSKGQRVTITGSFFIPANMKTTNGLTEGNATSTGWAFTKTSM